MYFLCEFQSKTVLKTYATLPIGFVKIYLTRALFSNICVVCTWTFAYQSHHFLRISNGTRVGLRGVSVFNVSSNFEIIVASYAVSGKIIERDPAYLFLRIPGHVLQNDSLLSQVSLPASANDPPGSLFCLL